MSMVSRCRRRSSCILELALGHLRFSSGNYGKRVPAAALSDAGAEEASEDAAAEDASAEVAAALDAATELRRVRVPRGISMTIARMMTIQQSQRTADNTPQLGAGEQAPSSSRPAAAWLPGSVM